MRKTRFPLIAAALAALLFCTGTALAASGPDSHTLGDTTVHFSRPDSKHDWVNKNSDLGLKFIPARYAPVIRHVISIYARDSFNSPTKAYNNHCAVFFIGPRDKIWSIQDFAELKDRLMPRPEPPEGDELEAEGEYLLKTLEDGVGLKMPKRKAKKYYLRLQQSTVLRDTPDAVALTLRHKKKGEKDKQITMSLALVNGKLLGTVYYQVSPGKKERTRVANLTLVWQDALISANSLRAGE